MLDEMQLWVAGQIKVLCLPEPIVGLYLGHLGTATLHGLKDEDFAGDMLVDEIEREQGMTKVIKDTEEQNDVEPLAELGDIVNRQFPIFDVEAADLSGEPRLGQVARIGIDADDSGSSGTLRGDRVITGVAADIEYTPTSKLGSNQVPKATALNGWVIAKKVVGRCLYAGQLYVVEPGTQGLYAPGNFLGGKRSLLQRAAHRFVSSVCGLRPCKCR